MQFGVSKTEANDTFNYWLKIFRKVLPCSMLEQLTKLSSNWIYVEHVIRPIEIFRAARERFSMNDQKYEQIILTICGLVRLRGCLKSQEIVKFYANRLTMIRIIAK